MTSLDKTSFQNDSNTFTIQSHPTANNETSKWASVSSETVGSQNKFYNVDQSDNPSSLRGIVRRQKYREDKPKEKHSKASKF